MKSNLHRHLQKLNTGLEATGVGTSEATVERLLSFLGELAEWNRAYNLTAVREPGEMVVRHLLDSAAVMPWLPGGELLDVGAGAGLPGIPLAILDPSRSVVLLDANGKKARFMRHALRRLGLDNARVLECRVEDCRDGPFPVIIARAYAEPALFLGQVRRLSPRGGAALAMIGRKPENAPVAAGFDFERCVRLDVPELDAERHLLIYRRWPESSQ